MTEQTNPTPEDGEVELVATVTFRWMYTANPSDYGGKTDPEAMAAIDAENYLRDPLMYVEGEPTVTVEPTGTERVDVVLTYAGTPFVNKPMVIKELRATFPEAGIVGAVNLAREVPSVVCENVSAADGRVVATRLRALGATVELRPHVAVTPLDQFVGILGQATEDPLLTLREIRGDGEQPA
jgi:ribosomal protein L7/L12